MFQNQDKYHDDYHNIYIFQVFAVYTYTLYIVHNLTFQLLYLEDYIFVKGE